MLISNALSDRHRWAAVGHNTGHGVQVRGTAGVEESCEWPITTQALSWPRRADRGRGTGETGNLLQLISRRLGVTVIGEQIVLTRERPNAGDFVC
jgi:hypothetical protein